MTQDTVTNFAASLVEMAKATEALPALQAEISRLTANAIEDGERIARLEMKLMDRADEIATLTTKLRSVEAERDDAGFRHLEAEDKIAALTASLRTVFSSVGETLKAAQPVNTPEPVVSVPVDPTTATTHDSSPTVLGDTTTSVSSAVSSFTDTGHGIYFNKRYFDIPSFISRDAWLANGGTEADYDWRPEPVVIHPTPTGQVSSTDLPVTNWWEEQANRAIG